MADPYAGIASPQTAADPYAGIASPVPDVAPPSAPKPKGAAMYVESPRPQPPSAQPAAPAVPSKPWSEVGMEAVRNIPASAGNFLSSLVQPILHPADTYESLAKVATGLVAPPSFLGQETPEDKAARTAPANAVGQFFKDRYGGMENIKNTLATDPVGAAADLSTVLSGGAMLPGRVGATLGTVSRAIDPVTQGVNALKMGGKAAEVATSNALGMTTGAGTDSVRAAGRAGREGGENAKAFTDSMRGNTPVEDVVNTAKSAVDQIRQERSQAYKAGMADLAADKTVMDFAPIDAAVGKASQVGSFKGVTVEPKAQGIVSEMRDTVENWKALDPAEYHTPEGIDALKRTLGNIRDSAAYGTPERVAADRVYNAVRGELTAQAPEYAKTMEAYAQASDKLKETTRTLSLGEKATGDTAARKLLSATRNNVQTNYGQRQKLIDALSELEPTLPYQIAGQGMNALAPRGIVARLAAMGSMSPTNVLATGPLLPAFSPRVVGEGAYYAGKGAGMAERGANALRLTEENMRRAGRGAYQTGRQQEAR